MQVASTKTICLSETGRLPKDGCHRNMCEVMSDISLDVEREEREERERNQEGHYVLRKERGDHTGHKETPTTRASPFIVHNTSLFTFFSKSVHFVHSYQLIATEALNKGLQNRRFQPFPLDTDRGGTEEGRLGTSNRESCPQPQYNRAFTDMGCLSGWLKWQLPEEIFRTFTQFVYHTCVCPIVLFKECFTASVTETSPWEKWRRTSTFCLKSLWHRPLESSSFCPFMLDGYVSRVVMFCGEGKVQTASLDSMCLHTPRLPPPLLIKQKAENR